MNCHPCTVLSPCIVCPVCPATSCPLCPSCCWQPARCSPAPLYKYNTSWCLVTCKYLSMWRSMSCPAENYTWFASYKIQVTHTIGLFITHRKWKEAGKMLNYGDTIFCDTWLRSFFSIVPIVVLIQMVNRNHEHSQPTWIFALHTKSIKALNMFTKCFWLSTTPAI